MRTSLSFILSLAFGVSLSAQSEPTRVDLRQFVNGTDAIAGLKSGRVSYITNPNDPTLFEELSYDYPNFAEGTFTDVQGNAYSTLARYNRETFKIEVILDGALFAINESDIPRAIIGERSYVRALLIGKSSKEFCYLEVQARSEDGSRMAAKKFLVYQASNPTQNRGIVTPARTQAYKLDSVTYLLGFRQLPFEVPRSSKQLISYLDACEGRALKASGRFKHKDDAFMRTFLDLVSGCE